MNWTELSGREQQDGIRISKVLLEGLREGAIFREQYQEQFIWYKTMHPLLRDRCNDGEGKGEHPRSSTYVNLKCSLSIGKRLNEWKNDTRHVNGGQTDWEMEKNRITLWRSSCNRLKLDETGLGLDNKRDLKGLKPFHCHSSVELHFTREKRGRIIIMAATIVFS